MTEYLSHKKAFLISFGLSGHSIHYYPYRDGKLTYGGCTLSGYDKPDRFQKELSEDKYKEYDLENCLVIDKRSVLENDPRLAISMPMCGHKTSKLNGDDISDMLIDGLQGEFKTLAILGKQENFSGLDQVEPKIYKALWSDAGAKTGKIVGKSIVWD